jgi:hypothetical protein
MAGALTHPLGRAPRRGRRAAALLALALGLGLLLLIGGSASPPDAGAAKAAQECPAQPFGLAPPPTADPASRFTMMIRINTDGNVNSWTQFNTSPGKDGLAPYVRPQDIFVLNTRFTGSGQFPPMTSAVAAQLSAELRAAFPCNRIVDLNGLSLDPTQAGYAFTGIDDPNTYAMLTDFEKLDWNSTAFTQPGRPPWTDDFAAALPRIKGWDFTLASTVAANPIGAGKRTGLVPFGPSSWNFGQIAQDLNKKNSRLGATKLGPMVVQTQDSCPNGTFATTAKNLRTQYTFKFITKKIKVKGKKKPMKKTIRLPLQKKGKPILDNLAMELSLSAVPVTSSNMALLRTSAVQAAACIQPAMKQGVGAFFFFAAEDAMRLLFQQPQVAAFRPPIGAVTSAATGGGVGSVGAPG